MGLGCKVSQPLLDDDEAVLGAASLENLSELVPRLACGLGSLFPSLRFDSLGGCFP
jgi:hypothetical protein